MQNRLVVAVCNLKPVTMRGVKSAAMVLAASPKLKPGDGEGGEAHKGPVELVDPPEGAKAGDRCWFEGWEGEPEGQLNPKKKVWESCQVGFGTGGGGGEGSSGTGKGAEGASGTGEGGNVGSETGKGPEVGFESAAVEVLRGEGRVKAWGKLVAQGGGVCTVKSLRGATVR